MFSRICLTVALLAAPVLSRAQGDVSSLATVPASESAADNVTATPAPAVAIVAPVVTPAPVNPLKESDSSSTLADYLLRPADNFQVKIFQEEDLTREVSISQEFTISLPLIGTIDLTNRTVRQAEELIRQLYDRDFIVNPQVNITMIRYAERAVNVIGMVNSPQVVPFPPERGLTLLEAITRAGGFSRLGDKENVKITRKDEKGVSTTFTVNAEKLLNSKSANSWSLQVDDIVNVPEKFF
jgi:polysaccharide biosynthesis/export protein